MNRVAPRESESLHPHAWRLFLLVISIVCSVVVYALDAYPFGPRNALYMIVFTGIIFGFGYNFPDKTYHPPTSYAGLVLMPVLMTIGSILVAWAGAS